MDTTVPSPEGAGAILTEIVAQPDRRASPRTECHTVVTAVTPPEFVVPELPSVHKAHSENISAGGAKLIAREPLPSRRFFLRFLLPTHWDRFLEAEVVGESVRQRKSLITRITSEYVYHVRFTGVERSAQEMGQLLSAIVKSSSSGQDDDRE